jgi:hypothetical protein
MSDPCNGQLVTDGYHQFRIVNGQRQWLSPPPQTQLMEMQLEAHSLRLSQSLRPHVEMSASACIPPVKRTVYVLTDSHGWCLYQLDGNLPAFSPDPTLAVRNGYAWLVHEEAQKRRITLIHQLDGAAIGITAVELVRGGAGWQAISMAGVPL